MLNGESEFVALFRQTRELFMRAEVIGRYCKRPGPALDAFAQGTIDIFEGVGRGLVSRFTDTIENAPRDGLLPGFVTQECVFESHMIVARIESHGFGELVAGGFVLADFEQSIGQILTQSGTVGRDVYSGLKRGDRTVVILGADRLVSLFERCVGG